jgi:hypothetical protein
MKTFKVALSVLLLLAVNGCTVVRRATAPEVGHFYLNPYVDFNSVGKVVVLELRNKTAYPDVSEAITVGLTESLKKKHIFTLNTLRHNDPVWRDMDLQDSSSYSLEELAMIRQNVKADAVMFGSITNYEPFPHMSMSMQLKLVDLRSGKLLWAMEQVWDSSDRRLEERMKYYYNKVLRSGYEPIDWQLLTTSPRNFNKFVVYEVSRTLPEVNRYAQQARSSENVLNFSGKSGILQKTLEIPKKTFKFAKDLTTIE